MRLRRVPVHLKLCRSRIYRLLDRLAISLKVRRPRLGVVSLAADPVLELEIYRLLGCCDESTYRRIVSRLCGLPHGCLSGAYACCHLRRYGIAGLSYLPLQIRVLAEIFTDLVHERIRISRQCFEVLRVLQGLCEPLRDLLAKGLVLLLQRQELLCRRLHLLEQPADIVLGSLR